MLYCGDFKQTLLGISRGIRTNEISMVTGGEEELYEEIFRGIPAEARIGDRK